MKKLLAGLLAALMIFSAAPMTGLAAQAEEWAAAVESVVAAREEADAPNSFGAAVKDAVQSLGRFLQDTVTRLVQQNLQESSAAAAVLTGAENTAPAANSAGNAVARAAAYGDYTYQVLADGTAEITDYTGSATELVIPSEIDGYPVTSIGNHAFENCSFLIGVTIPEGVKNIDELAFNHCTSLEKIDIPATVTSIEGFAFANCTKLTQIDFPDSLTYIGEYAFHKCSNIQEIILPPNIRTIRHCAFAGTQITVISIPNSASTLYSRGGTTYKSAFWGAERLTKIIFENGRTEIPVSALRGCPQVTSVVIPETITSIGDYAFSGCSGLTSIEFPSNVMIIGSYAFENCRSLISIKLPDSVTSIRGAAFEGCTSLTNITVDSDNEKYTDLDGILYNKEQTEIIRYPARKKAISYKIPDSVTSIKQGAFEGCNSLMSIELPNSVTSIEDRAFQGCTSLTNITISDNTTSIGSSAFQDCTSLMSIEIPDSVTGIGTWAFSNCDSLVRIDIPGSITQVSTGAFERCKSLTNVVIRNGVQQISWDAFKFCGSLAYVIIPDSIWKIDTNAFYGCGAFTDIYYSGGEEQWENVFKHYPAIPDSITIHYNSYFSNKALIADALNGETLSVSVYDKTPFLESTASLVVTGSGQVNALLNGVTLTVGSYTETFDKKTVLQPSLAGQQAVFTCNGFRDYILPAKVLSACFDASFGQQNLYLEKDKKDGKPYLSTAFARKAGSDGRYIELQSEKLSAAADTQYEVILSANLAGGSSATYYLSQDDAHKLSSTTGVFPAVELSEAFAPNRDIYAYVQTSAGTSEPVKLKIELTDFKAPSNTFSLIGSDGQKLRIDDSFPLVGGAEISLDGFKFPLGIEIEGNRFKISFGVDVFSLKSSNGGKWKNDTWDSFKKSVSTIHSSVTSAAEKMREYKKFYDTFAPGQAYVNSAKNFDVGFLGYAEGNLVNGKMIFTEFSGEIATQFSFQYTHQGVVWVIPYYAYVNAGASLAAKLNSVRSVPDSSVPFDFGFALQLTPELTVGGGAGIKGAISGGLYGKGSLPMGIDFAQKHTTGSLAGEIGVEAELFCFKGKKAIFTGQMTLWDKYYGNTKSIPQAYANRLQRLEQEKQTDTTLLSRDYLKNTSGWMGGYQPLTRSRAAIAEGLAVKPLQTSVFKNVQTQLVSLKDGRMMMAWIQDDASRDDYNRLQLVYSIWENGVWSTPKAVDNDGTNDGSPVLATDGETVFIAWQNLKRSLTEADEDAIDAVLKSTELCIAQYDAKADSFTGKKTLTDNEAYEYAPALAVNAGEAVLYWVGSGADDLTESGGSTLYRYTTTENQVEIVKEGMNYILNMACAFVDGRDQVAYSMDQDGDVSTTNDVKAFTLASGKQTQLTPKNEELETADFAVAYGELDGKTTAFFADASDIYYVQDGGAKKVFTSPRSINGDLQVLSQGENTLLVWTEVSEAGTELFQCSYAAGAWSEPVQLSKTGALLHDVSAVLHNGQVYGVFGRTERTQEDGVYVNGQTDLCAMEATEFTDLEASFAVIDESQFVKGEDTTLSVYLKNNGTSRIDTVTLTLTDTLGTELIVEKEVQLASGAETIVEVRYPVPQNYGRTELTLTAAVPSAQETNIQNNADTESLGFADISIGDMKVEDVGNYFILTAVLSNDNQVSANGVKVEVRSGSRDGELLDSIEVGTMQPGDLQAVQYVVAKDSVSFDAEMLGQIHFVASLTESAVRTRSMSTTGERITEDNATGAVLEASELASPCEEHIYGDYVIEREATCMGQGLAYRVCENCGHKDYKDIAPTGHTFTEWTVTQEPTCTEAGLKIHTCTKCGVEITESIPKLTHEADENAWIIVKEPTETEDGLKVLKCKYCGEVLKEEVIPATGSEIDPEVPEEATLTLTLDGQAVEGDVAYVKLPSILMMYKNHSATLGFAFDQEVEVASVNWSYANWSVDSPEANIESPTSAETVIRPNGKGIGARSTWVTLTVTDVEGNTYQQTVKVRFYKWDWQRK